MLIQSIQITQHIRSVLVCLALLVNCLTAQAEALNESPEIVYSSPDAQRLRDKATQLGTAVAIYEYVHNTIEHSAYHGSRSGSVNTFLGQRGSDVDIATVLIAMLRSQNIPARYAVGTVRIPAMQLTNWLGIPHLDTAVEVLKSQGIQGVTLAGDRSTLDFEHAWVEALVPFDQYRGINTVSPAVDCSQAANAARCTWVALDASFKQKTYNGLNLDPYNAVSFDYTAYYNAIKNNDATRRDKNPLTILEDQIGAWLRSNYTGKTLEDVEDAGQIIPLREGLLPASLPFQTVGSIRRYDNADAHDGAVPANEPKKWIKYLTATPRFDGIGFGAITVRLAELTTKRLTYSYTLGADGTAYQSFLLGGVQLGGRLIINPGASVVIGNTVIKLGAPFTLAVTMDGAPGVTIGAADRSISAEYAGILGGYYLVATGGESSNWSQVHRAADQLLSANDQHKIVFNPSEAGCLADGINCTPYVDANGNGWDALDTKLLESKPALDALTGGLLYVGATQYYAKLREQYERTDRLMKTKTPVIGFLGVVSSVYEAEYIDGTAFSILPGGLLIDMKGITIGGSYRTNESAVSYSNRQFEFLSHITSSLEHEIWQELTGYDAVSTVRGIQMALANGAVLVNPKKNATEDTLPGQYASLGFATTPPTGFSYTPFTISTTSPASWKHATTGTAFDTFESTVNTSTSELRNMTGTYAYSPDGGLYGWSKCVSDQIAKVNTLTGTITGKTCAGVSFSGSRSSVLSVITNDWKNNIIPNYIGQNYFDYFDRNKGFATSNRVYRTYPPAIDQHETITIASLRSDLYRRDLNQTWVEYLLPSKLVTGATYRFSVDMRKVYDTAKNRLLSVSMEILNKSFTAGGGYMGLEQNSYPSSSNQNMPQHSDSRSGN